MIRIVFGQWSTQLLSLALYKMRLRTFIFGLGLSKLGPKQTSREFSVLTKMSTSIRERGDHLSVTAQSFRGDVVSLATVNLIEILSPTVKRLTLAPHQPKDLVFKAGQWVDFFIPDVSTVGGFSMCSSPQTLREKGILELAVKYSKHPPAKWVHTQCRSGDVVGMKVGGDFFFDPIRFSTSLFTESASPPPSVLLVAGGVGINPILSILEEFSANVKNQTINPQSRATLLYSASTREELLFRDRIDAIAESTSGVSVLYFVTKEGNSSFVDPRFALRRIDQADLGSAFSRDSSNCSNFESFICGPPTMIDWLVSSFKQLGVAQEKVHYEKWW